MEKPLEPTEQAPQIKAIIGLGNPGKKFEHTRHNAGFMVVDELARRFGAPWQSKELMDRAEVMIGGRKVLLIKPLTFMNNSGQVLPSLQKQGIKAENILVVHDELELPFGTLKFKSGGSHKGHNGLRSIISYIGDAFHRLRVGIGRPEDKDHVPAYVLEEFDELLPEIQTMINQAADMIEDFLAG